MATAPACTVRVRRQFRRRSAAALAVAALCFGATACSDAGSAADEIGEGVTDPSPTATSGAGTELVRPEGFERVAATLTGVDGTLCEVCLWLAETGDQRSSGLMGVTDVGDSDGIADGMAFVYPRPHTGTFWMKNTLVPLSIAFFADSGAYLSSFDMEPCTADPCPTYPTPADFSVAIEVPQGNLPALAIGPGTTLDLTNLPCPENRPD